MAIMKIVENSNEHCYDNYFDWFLMVSEESELGEAKQEEVMILTEKAPGQLPSPGGFTCSNTSKCILPQVTTT
jgi:hypothetical protein